MSAIAPSILVFFDDHLNLISALPEPHQDDHGRRLAWRLLRPGTGDRPLGLLSPTRRAEARRLDLIAQIIDVEERISRSADAASPRKVLALLRRVSATLTAPPVRRWLLAEARALGCPSPEGTADFILSRINTELVPTLQLHWMGLRVLRSPQSGPGARPREVLWPERLPPSLGAKLMPWLEALYEAMVQGALTVECYLGLLNVANASGALSAQAYGRLAQGAGKAMTERLGEETRWLLAGDARRFLKLLSELNQIDPPMVALLRVQASIHVRKDGVDVDYRTRINGAMKAIECDPDNADAHRILNDCVAAADVYSKEPFRTRQPPPIARALPTLREASARLQSDEMKHWRSRLDIAGQVQLAGRMGVFGTTQQVAQALATLDRLLKAIRTNQQWTGAVLARGVQVEASRVSPILAEAWWPALGELIAKALPNEGLEEILRRAPDPELAAYVRPDAIKQFGPLQTSTERSTRWMRVAAETGAWLWSSSDALLKLAASAMLALVVAAGTAAGLHLTTWILDTVRYSRVVDAAAQGDPEHALSTANAYLDAMHGKTSKGRRSQVERWRDEAALTLLLRDAREHDMSRVDALLADTPTYTSKPAQAR